MTFTGDVFPFACDGNAKFDVDEDNGDAFEREDADVKDEPNPPRFNAIPPLCVVVVDAADDVKEDDDNDNDDKEIGEAEEKIILG